LSSINDNIKLATGGNSVADGLSSWYSRTGNESLDDAESRWLSSIDTQGGGSNSDMWFNILRSAGYIGSLVDMKAAYWGSPITFPSELTDLKMWTRFNQGITVTGSGVSQWDDQSGNGNHLKQAVDSKRPTKQPDGAILCNGIDNLLKADAFTFNQPEEIFILARQTTWAGSDRFFDGNALNSGTLQKFTATPQLRIFAGGVVGNISLTLAEWGVVTVVFNGASSLLQLNNDAPVTGDAGLSNMGGFTLGASGGDTDHAYVEFKEVIAVDTTLDAATRTQIIAYLSSVGGL